MKMASPRPSSFRRKPESRSEPHAPTGNLPTGTVSVETASEDLTFSVEIAETDATREWGLMGRSSLPQGSGMAFVYESPTDGPFWMKDTPIPLTIAFWRSDGTIVDVLDMEPCETESCPRYRPSGAYVGALEVNQGSLYPALYRLRDRGLIRSQPGVSGEGRIVKVYRLTRKGRRALAVEREEWRRFSEAVEAILATG